jgi:drug/metabolite transporter (DMT)-like permease
VGQHLLSNGIPASPTDTRNDTVAGAISLSAGLAIFSVQDVVVKLLSGAYPVYEVITIRSVIALPLLWMLVRMEGGRVFTRSPRLSLQLVRGVLMFTSYTIFYLGLVALPFAICVGLFFVAPLFITLLSAVFLGETVRVSRWAAILLGFSGVLVILRPGTEVFEPAALLPVAAGITHAGSQILARDLGKDVSASVMSFHGSVVYLAGGLALTLLFGSRDSGEGLHESLAFLVRGWKDPAPFDLLLLAACGVIAAVGLTLVSQAYRVAQASVMAPFEYIVIVLGVAYGWFIWGEFPNLLSWTGIAIIVGSGLYVVATGRAHGRARESGLTAQTNGHSATGTPPVKPEVGSAAGKEFT